MIPLLDENRARFKPYATWTLIIINVVVFLFEAALPDKWLNLLTQDLGVVPARMLEYFGIGQILTVFTSAFLHGSWLHLLANMWALHIFGDNVEDRMGHFRFVVFYYLCAFVAAFTHIFLHPHAVSPMVGASGAIAGVLGAYILLFPAAKIITLIPIFFFPLFINVPAYIYLGLWILSQFVSGTFTMLAGSQAAETGGVAFWAHVGGFIAGLVLVKVFENDKYQEYHSDEYFPW